MKEDGTYLIPAYMEIKFSVEKGIRKDDPTVQWNECSCINVVSDILTGLERMSSKSKYGKYTVH